MLYLNLIECISVNHNLLQFLAVLFWFQSLLSKLTTYISTPIIDFKTF